MTRQFDAPAEGAGVDATSGVQLLDPAQFDGKVDGKPVRLFTLRNSRGMVACVTNYGAKIEQILVPDRDGNFGDVVLGYGSLAAAIHGSPSMGAFIGRYAGRIGNARFSLNRTLTLPRRKCLPRLNFSFSGCAATGYKPG